MPSRRLSLSFCNNLLDRPEVQRQWRLRANFLFQKNNSCRCDPLIFWVCSGKWQVCSDPCHICGILSLCEVTPAEEVGVQSSDWKGLWWPTSTTCQLFCFVFVAVCWTVSHKGFLILYDCMYTKLTKHILEMYLSQAKIIQLKLKSDHVTLIGLDICVPNVNLIIINCNLRTFPQGTT